MADDFLDDLLTNGIPPTPPTKMKDGRPTGFFACPAKAVSGKALSDEYGGARLENLPPVAFETDGVLENPEDFPAGVSTVAEAMEHIRKLTNEA